MYFIRNILREHSNPGSHAACGDFAIKDVLCERETFFLLELVCVGVCLGSFFVLTAPLVS